MNRKILVDALLDARNCDQFWNAEVAADRLLAQLAPDDPADYGYSSRAPYPPAPEGEAERVAAAYAALAHPAPSAAERGKKEPIYRAWNAAWDAHPAPAAPRAEEACIYTKADAEALCAIAVAAAQPDAAKYRALTTPEIHNFIVAVEREALHQRDRWAAEHDAGKTDADWFWLVGYLAGKAINKPDKILHHIITTAAACLNWHAAKLGTHTAMRPGIEEPK